jgi:hypothetical protein
VERNALVLADVFDFWLICAWYSHPACNAAPVVRNIRRLGC